LLIAALAAAALVVVPSAIPQTVVGRTVLRTIELRPGTTKALAVSCPAGYLAVSAGVSRPAPGVTTLSVRATGPRTFLARFRNPAASPRRKVSVGAACRRTAEGSARLRLKLLKLVTARVGPSSQKRVELSCPPGTFPGAAGFDFGRTGEAPLLASERQTFRALTFRVANPAAVARTVSLHAGCLTAVRPPGSSTRLQVSLTSDTVQIEPGAHVVTRRCTAGWLALSAGFSMRRGLEIQGAAVTLRAGRWSVTSRAEGELPATFELVCGRLVD
jgi:hypothetical protein